MRIRQLVVVAFAVISGTFENTYSAPIVIDDFSTGPFRSFQLFTPEQRAVDNRLGNVRLGGLQMGLTIPGRSRDISLASILYSL